MTNRIDGTDGNDPLTGTSGSDLIFGADGNDTINGGAGSDILYGGQGDDTYHWDPVTGGRDQVKDTGGNDTLHINALASELTFSSRNNGFDLRIQFGHVSHLDITQYFGSAPIETFVFADGTIWTRAQLLAALTTPLIPSENMGPEILRMDGGRVTEGGQSLDLVVGFIRAHDENGDALTYTLLDDAGGRFRLDGHAIRVDDWSLIDYEATRFHEIRVLVKDASGATAEETFTIEILDRQVETTPPPPKPNHTPDISWIDAEDIPETATGGYVVGTIHGYDSDGDTLTYTTPVGYDGPFMIVGNQIVVREGAVLVGGTISYMPITVSDGRGGSVTRTFDFKIKDVLPENHAPQISWIDAEDVPETATGGYLVGMIHGYDPDGDVLSYSVPTGYDGPFTIIDNKIYVREGAVLVGGTTSYMPITVSDGNGGSVTRVFDFKIKDVVPDNQAPHDISLSNNWVVENSSNETLIGVFSAVDPDGDNLSFELLSNADGRFALRGEKLVVADGSKLDYETNAAHTVKVRVTDGHGGSAIQTFTIKVRDITETPGNRAPRDVSISGNWAAENASNGTLVGVISAHDPDGDDLSFELIDNASGRFKLVGTELVVADGSKLDYEASHFHTVKVRVSDGHGGSSVQAFDIMLQDLAEPGGPLPPTNQAPVDIALSNQSIDENSASETSVGILATFDPDAGERFTYNLLDDAGGRFKLVGSKLVVADGSKLDYEVASAHKVKVKVTDAGGLSFIKSFTIDVEDVIGEMAVGTTRDDVVFGGEGNDKLAGGHGKDVLSGGVGKDIFLFNTKLTKGSVDRITDFSVKDDTIQLARSVFTKIGTKGTLSKNAFWKGTKAHDADDRIIYNIKSGALSFDADGAGGKAAIKFAELEAGLKNLSYRDFMII